LVIPASCYNYETKGKQTKRRANVTDVRRNRRAKWKYQRKRGV